MQEFDWIHKAFFGIFGTLLSIVLEYVSTTVSIFAGAMTIWYIWVQIKYITGKHNRAEDDYNYQLNKRKESR